MPTKILIVDDDLLLAHSIKELCEDQYWEAYCAISPLTAISLLQEKSFDVVITEHDFCKGSAFELIDYLITTQSNTKILMLSQIADCYSRIHAYEQGVDDYVAKPFHPDELILKIKKLVHHKHVAKDQFIATPYFVLDLYSGEVVTNDWSIKLRRKEFEILTLLIQHKNQVMTKEMIMERTWNTDTMPLYSTIDVHIRRIRLQIKDRPKRIIKTIYGIGYKYFEPAM